MLRTERIFSKQPARIFVVICLPALETSTVQPALGRKWLSGYRQEGSWQRHTGTSQTQGQPRREKLPSRCTLPVNCSLLIKAGGRGKASWHHKERQVIEPTALSKTQRSEPLRREDPPSAVSRHSQNFPVCWKKGPPQKYLSR